MIQLKLTIFLILITISASSTTELLFQQQKIQQLEIQIESLNPLFLDYFVQFYHLNQEQNASVDILNHTRIIMKKGTYFMLLGKMYLYKMLPNNNVPALQFYDTKSQYTASYYYLKLASQMFQNPQAYFLIGVLEQFKIIPDKVLQANLAKLKKSKNQQKLIKYLEQSHLYNVQSNLYMSSAFGFDPASLALAFLNKNRLGTSKNCTASLAYYISVIKNTYVESFFFRQVYTFPDSFEDQLYNKKKLTYLHDIKGHFIQDTDYFDEQTISATSQLADNYYMGRGGYIRNAKKAAELYQKLAKGGSSYGKLMAGICYFKGEGVPINRQKAKAYFQQNPKDQLCQYMLIAMKYFEMTTPGSKPQALRIMLQKYKLFKKQKQKISSHLIYLIGASIIKGELKDKQVGSDKILPISEAEGISMIDHAANNGLPMAKVLLGILFADGTNGLKYGCQEAVKYFYEDSLTFPYFKNRVSMANAAMHRGQIAFALIKFMQLTLIGYETAYINILFIIEVYKNEFLRLNQHSWSIKDFNKNKIYRQVRTLHFISIESLFIKQYNIKQSPIINLNNIQSYLKIDDAIIQQIMTYIRKKTIKWGSISEKKNILKYYEYMLALEDQQNPMPILTSLASGESSKPYVSQARYLLGRLQHRIALSNKSSISPQEHFKIINDYRRAVKSELLGNLIFSIQDYFIRRQFQFGFFQSDVGQDLLAYIFILSLLIFLLYYLRSKRLDKFHKTELQKQHKKAEQEQQQTKRLQQQKQRENSQKIVYQNQVADLDQPIIIQDEPKGVRIGSSLEVTSS